MRRVLLGCVGLMGAWTFAMPGAHAGVLEPFLSRLADAQRVEGTVPAACLLAWDETEAARGRARVMLARTATASWESLRQELGAALPTMTWEGEADRWAQAVFDWSDLPRVAATAGIAAVTRPPRGVPLVESEGLTGIEARRLHDLGYSGEPARVAIVDLGFTNYERQLGTELPGRVRVRSFFRSPSGQGDITGDPDQDHGTACAEIVADLAPGAQIYLVNVESPVDLKNAVDWLIEQKVSVISHSVGWYFGGLDGQGPINDIADRAARSGVLWVNAAGNEAQRHTWAHAVDLDADDLFEFEGDERIDFARVRPGETVSFALLWDQWPLATSVDVVLELFAGASEMVASSEAQFANYPYAFRFLEWSADRDGPVSLQIRRVRGSFEGRTLHLFRIGSGTRMEEHARADRSLLVPADSPSVLAVGATYWATDSLDSYSSRGAQGAAAPKPELCAPVGVSTATYGPLGFRGTSAAAPHVAGAAALVASTGLRGAFIDLLWSREEIRDLLRHNARPAPAIPSLAWGLLHVPVPGASSQTDIRFYGNPAAGTLAWDAPCDRVEVLDASGRVVARLTGRSWNGVLPGGDPLPAGVYWLRGSGSAGAARFLWLGGRGR